MNSVDIFIHTYLSNHSNAFLQNVLYFITGLFDISPTIFIFIFGVTFLIYIVRTNAYAFLFLSSLLFGVSSTYLLKAFFDVNRPGTFAYVLGQSFPSNHAAVSTIFFIMLMFIFDRYFTGFSRKLFNIFCVVMILLVAFSRVYLGFHWVSDVLGGIAWGIIISYLSILIFRYTHGESH